MAMLAHTEQKIPGHTECPDMVMLAVYTLLSYTGKA